MAVTKEPATEYRLRTRVFVDFWNYELSFRLRNLRKTGPLGWVANRTNRDRGQGNFDACHAAFRQVENDRTGKTATRCPEKPRAPPYISGLFLTLE